MKTFYEKPSRSFVFVSGNVSIKTGEARLRGLCSCGLRHTTANTTSTHHCVRLDCIIDLLFVHTNEEKCFAKVIEISIQQLKNF